MLLRIIFVFYAVIVCFSFFGLFHKCIFVYFLCPCDSSPWVLLLLILNKEITSITQVIMRNQSTFKLLQTIRKVINNINRPVA